ncbi:uncharacterized protein LTR77_007651 [Saxophila tyrrhenica]|uniref:HBS1-like protein N-terminal domain-containing protein n=1 Tax=Saxophila tyrrhenica TaxID=1690608 RepID=A0AAV9P2M2_9PEZI|nr:hypothetical protein LTR77_007651 [Saxophila tyrrhenica]
MQRVKNVDYDEDDIYSEEDDYQEEEQTYTEEDRENFNTLTPVVRAELQEAGLQASDREVEDALWHYYWDVSKSVAYLKNTRTPRPQQQQGKKEKEKPKNKFDQAAERSAEKADKMPLPPTSAAGWFSGISWSVIPDEVQGELLPAVSRPRPHLLGGSSKLARLAEERRKKAAASSAAPAESNGTLSSLDRLSKPKDAKENLAPPAKSEPRKYPIRQKRDPTPPPKEPSPEPEEPEEMLPDLRASPTEFAKTMATSRTFSKADNGSDKAISDLFRSSSNEDPFKGPSPDDTVLGAQGHSKGINK